MDPYSEEFAWKTVSISLGCVVLSAILLVTLLVYFQLDIRLLYKDHFKRLRGGYLTKLDSDHCYLLFHCDFLCTALEQDLILISACYDLRFGHDFRDNLFKKGTKSVDLLSEDSKFLLSS